MEEIVITREAKIQNSSSDSGTELEWPDCQVNSVHYCPGTAKYYKIIHDQTSNEIMLLDLDDNIYRVESETHREWRFTRVQQEAVDDPVEYYHEQVDQLVNPNRDDPELGIDFGYARKVTEVVESE